MTGIVDSGADEQQSATQIKKITLGARVLTKQLAPVRGLTLIPLLGGMLCLMVMVKLFRPNQ